MHIFLIIAGVILFLLLLWLFLIAPRPRKRAVEAFRVPYSHRGLFGGEVPENSLPAFRRAAEAGFGIELDVRLSADGEVFVFHDDTLTRMCGADVRFSSLTAAELRQFRLADTQEGIPTFREVLAAVDGRVPLLIELKGESADTSVCPATAALLDGYGGAWCVESFNPFLLTWFRKHRKGAVRGLLVTDLIREKKKGSKAVNFALSAMWFNFLGRPAFIAFDRKYPGALSRRVAMRLFGAVCFVYTVRDRAEYERFLAAGYSPIFEGFVPENK